MKLHFMAMLLLAATLSARVAQAQSDEEGRYHWEPLEVLPLNDSVAVYHVSFGSDEHGLAIMDRKGNALHPEIHLPKNVLDVALFHGKVLAFYQPDLTNNNRVVRVQPVDLKTWKAEADQTVYSVTTPFVTRFFVEKDEHHDFLGLLGITTQYESKDQEELPMQIRHAAQRRKIGTAQLVVLSERLQPSMVTLQGVTAGSPWGTAAMNRQGALFLVTYSQGAVVAQKFDPSGSLDATLSVPMALKDEITGEYLASPDPTAGNILTLAMHGKTSKTTEAVAARFDFAAAKVYAAPTEVWNGDMLKNIRRDPATGKKLDCSSWLNYGENFTPVQILDTKDMVVLVREYEVLGKDEKGFWHGNYIAAVINTYDKQMKPLRRIVLDKELGVTAPLGPGVAVHWSDGHLLALTEEGSWGHAQTSIWLYDIDPQTGSVTKKEVRKAVPKSLYTEVSRIFWNSGKPLVNYVWLPGNQWRSKLRSSYEPLELQ